MFGRKHKVIRIALFLFIFTLILIAITKRKRFLQLHPLSSFLSLFRWKDDFITKVPNVVHFFHFIDLNKPGDKDPQRDVLDLSFISATCILAAAFNQEPDRIIIHTNINSTFNLADKKYWSLIFRILSPKYPPKKDTNKKKDKGDDVNKKRVPVLQIRYLKQPSHVFGQPLSSTFHAADVARINILLQEGGVALDQDTFIVRKLDASFFDQGTKVSLGWPKNQNIGTQILISAANAPFLKLWLQTYRDYKPSLWYYNAAEAPTKLILAQRPQLVNRVEELFGVHNLADKLYGVNQWLDWKDYYSIHLLSRHRDYLVKSDVEQSGILDFDETNIQNYTKAFGKMARSIWNDMRVVKEL